VLLTTAAVCATVIVVRPVWVFLTAWLSHSVSRVLTENVPAPRPTPAVLFVLGWAGMRGVISLAVALSLPHFTATGAPFPGRDLIVFITFAVILVTLVGQGLSLPTIIRRLGVGATADQTEEREISAQLRMARGAVHDIETIAAEMQIAPDVVERVRLFYVDRIERLEHRHTVRSLSAAAQADDAGARRSARELFERLIDVERVELQRLQNEGRVDNLVARRLQRGLDLQRLHDGPSRGSRPHPRGS